MKTRPVVEVVPEILEYNLEYSPDLRCEKQTDLVPICHHCKSCILSWRTFSTREWFLRASHASQRKFLVGIIKRFKSQDLLNYTWNLLRPTNNKDFIYSRSCVNSSLTASSTFNRALDPQELEKSMADLWKWFLNASFWTKANYILLLLQMCDSQLLLMAASLLCSLLSQDEKPVFTKEETEEDQAQNVKQQEKSTSRVMSHLASESTGLSSAFESYVVSETTSIFGHLRAQGILSRESDQLTESLSEHTDEDGRLSVIMNVTSPVCLSPKKTSNLSKYKDFIRCLPIHLSKRILRMLDHKSLSRCAFVSPHWNMLVKQIKKDALSNRALRSEIMFLKGSCPKGAVSNYAKIVRVATPKINEDGDIIPARSKHKQQSKEFEYMHKAYHGQETDTVKLEERNVFCGAYNVRVLINSLDPNRVVHYCGGKLLAVGSVDRKIYFLNVSDMTPVPLLLRGHAGSIRALYLCEQKGFLLSGSYDLSIRMWNILTGTCVKIFNGHSGSITCLDLYKTKFVSGSKDCTAKMWDIETGKCIKTFAHKGIVWAAKMNETHVVSSCDRGVVKVWHIESFILIKTLEGHLGPVTCLSFDEWHLVTGSNDGYVLGWSMLGKHKRCLMAFRHPLEVLYLGFLYLRVITGCADGKIRIFNFLNGTCLRVMRANSRGDPVLSVCIEENKLLINAKGSVVLFQFEEVEWDHAQSTERLLKRKDKSKVDDVPFQMKPSPQSEWQKRAKKNNWKLYREETEDTMLSYVISPQSTRFSKGLRFEMVKAPPRRGRENVATLDMKQDEKHRLSSLAKRLEDDEHEPSISPPPGQKREALLKYIKQKRPLGPITNDQILLTISTLHHAYVNDQVSINTGHNMKIKDAWGPDQVQKEQPQKSLAPKSAKQPKMNSSTQLKRLNAAGGTLGVQRISIPYETKTLQLNLKNTLFAGTVKSFIPAPTITRSKSCISLSGEPKAYGGQAKIPSPATAGEQAIGHFTTTSETIKIPRMKIGQPDKELSARRGKLLFTHTPDPYRLNTGFRLLTTQQMKEYEEAKISEYQANKTKVIANREKVCKKAWLRKIKGLPLDDFTKEGKVVAPELGENVFL
uniref:F-box and WD repeat domain containing protein 10B isoform X1 n=1 Tax=Pogona vitticeps TaxID=103695 RepID=A0ABM5FMA2_9SAUR